MLVIPLKKHERWKGLVATVSKDLSFTLFSIESPQISYLEMLSPCCPGAYGVKNGYMFCGRCSYSNVPGSVGFPSNAHFPQKLRTAAAVDGWLDQRKDMLTAWVAHQRDPLDAVLKGLMLHELVLELNEEFYDPSVIRRGFYRKLPLHKKCRTFSQSHQSMIL